MAIPSSSPESVTPAGASASRRPADRPTVAGAATTGGSGADRRKYFRLRDLIDEMLASVRVATNQELMTAEERADAERQLAVIMARVRSEALNPVERQGAEPTGDRAD